MDRRTTDSIKGLSAIVVMLYHLTFYSNNTLLSLIFTNTGQLAVAVFLFMSGYGLTVQYQKKGKDYFKGFWLNKIFRLILIFLISDVIVTIINNIYFDTNFGVLHIIKSAARFCYPNGRELWFVAIILFCYVCFYIGKKYLNNNILWTILHPCIYIIICIFFERGTWWYNTAFCFVVGELVAIYKEQFDRILKRNYTIVFMSMGVLFFTTEWLYRNGMSQMQYLCPVIFLMLLYLAIMKTHVNSKVLCFTNQMTFELYLVHLIVYKMFFHNNELPACLYILMYAVIFMLAYITMRIDVMIFVRIREWMGKRMKIMQN